METTLIIKSKLDIKILVDKTHYPGVVVHTCNNKTQEVEVGRLGVQSLPGLHSKTLCVSTATETH
jgi:hypothetical protein